jgi:hypothetical protein
MFVIPALGRLRQEDHELEASLSYIDPISKSASPPKKKKRERKEKHQKSALIIIKYTRRGATSHTQSQIALVTIRFCFVFVN